MYESNGVSIYRLPSVPEYLGNELRTTAEQIATTTDDAVKARLLEHMSVLIAAEAAFLQLMMKEVAGDEKAKFESVKGTNIIKFPTAEPVSDESGDEQ